MRLILFHGRNAIDQELDEWGFDFVPIEGVAGHQVTYFTHHRVEFESEELCAAAKALTGWERWDDRILLMRVEEDLVRVDNPALASLCPESDTIDCEPEATTAWFGDFSFAADIGDNLLDEDVVDSGGNLLALIEEVERHHFRTVGDTGANECAMVVWNALRAGAGLPRLDREHLPAWDGKKYVKPAGSPLLAGKTSEQIQNKD